MRKIKIDISIFLTGLAFGLIPYCHIVATRQRGYEAWGGEVLLPILPLVLLIYFVSKEKKADDDEEGEI